MNKTPILSGIVVVLFMSCAVADDKPIPKKIVRFESAEGLRLQALSPDSSKLAFVEQLGKGNCELVLLDLTSGKVLQRSACRKGWSGGFEGGVFSPDGKKLAMVFVGSRRGEERNAWQQELVIWDVERWEEVQTLQPPKGWIRATPLAFSPDGKLLAGKCRREMGHELDHHLPLLWELSTGKVRAPGEKEKLAIKQSQSRHPFPIRFPGGTADPVNPRLDIGPITFAEDNSDILFVQYAGGTSVFSLAQDKTSFNVPLFGQGPPASGNDRFRLRLTPAGRFLPLPKYERPPLGAFADREGIITLATLTKGEDFGRYSELASIKQIEEHCTFFNFRSKRSLPTVVLSTDGKRLVVEGLNSGDAAKSLLMVWDVSAFLELGQKLSSGLPTDERERLWARLFESHPDPVKSEHPGPETARFQQFRAHGAMISMVQHPKEAVEYLRKMMGAPVDLKPVTVWIENLDHHDFKTRDRAERELAKLDQLARPALEKALAGKPSAEVRKRIERLLAQWKETEAAYELRVFRVVDVLEHLRTAEARKILKEFSEGSYGSLYADAAKAALRRESP